MKALLTFLFVCSTFLTLPTSTSAQRDETYFYSSRYDNIDINNIFRSRLLNHYVDCLLDKKPCAPEGKDLKRVLPDALKTRCGRCSKIQKEKALDVITRLYYQHPKLYTALAERYDPTGEYTKNYERWFDEQNAVKPQQVFRQGQSNENEQQEVRRSPSSGVQNNFNDVPTERTRIPSTWITSTTTEPTTTRRITSTRATLRTTPTNFRTTSPTEEPPQIFREVAPIFRAAPVAPSSTFRTPPTFRTQPATSAIRTPAVKFEAPAIIREFPVTSRIPEPTFRQTSTFQEQSTILRTPQEPARQPERTQRPPVFRESPTQRATPQYVTSDQSFRPFEDNAQPSVIFRDTTTFRAQPEVSTFRTTIVRDQSPAALITNAPRLETSNIAPITNPQVFRSQEREQNLDVERESRPVYRPSVPVKDSPTYRSQTDFQVNQRTPIYRKPVAANQAPGQEVQNFARDLDGQGKRNEPAQIENEPDLIDRFFIPDVNARFRKSVEYVMDKTGKVVGNAAGMLRSYFQLITKTK